MNDENAISVCRGLLMNSSYITVDSNATLVSCIYYAMKFLSRLSLEMFSQVGLPHPITAL